MQTDTETLLVNRIVRDLCGACPSVPVVIEDIEGLSPEPGVMGESYHYVTLGGRPIRYPNAYKWPKIYVGSTLRVSVGREYWEAIRSLVRVAPLADPLAFLARAEVAS